MGVIDQEKGDSLLFLKLPHKFHLMFMNILKGKSIRRTLFGIKTDRNSLYRTDIVHRALLVKISQGNVPAFLVYVDGGNRRGHLLDQCQPVFQIFFIGPVDQIFQC